MNLWIRSCFLSNEDKHITTSQWLYQQCACVCIYFVDKNRIYDVLLTFCSCLSLLIDNNNHKQSEEKHSTHTICNLQIQFTSIPVHTHTLIECLLILDSVKFICPVKSSIFWDFSPFISISLSHPVFVYAVILFFVLPIVCNLYIYSFSRFAEYANVLTIYIRSNQSYIKFKTHGIYVASVWVLS